MWAFLARRPYDWRTKHAGKVCHHSCAVGIDAAGYDALGVQLSWKFNRGD